MIQLNNSNPNQIQELKLSTVDREFVDMVMNTITLYGQLPYTIPESMIITMIKSSAKYFYKYYANSQIKKHYYINSVDLKEYVGDNINAHQTNISKNNFITLEIPINPRIRVVTEVQETNQNVSAGGQGFKGFVNPTMNEQLTFGGDGSIGINNNLFVIETAVRMIETSVFNVIFSSKIPFDFTNGSNVLRLFRKPQDGSNIVLTTLADVDIHTLYNDTFFERHVIGKCKRELKRLLGAHTIELPGGVIMNVDEICNNLDDIEKVEDLVKAASGVGDIIMKR